MVRVHGKMSGARPVPGVTQQAGWGQKSPAPMWCWADAAARGEELSLPPLAKLKGSMPAAEG